MLARAFIVVLLVLNVGVAAWWLTRTPPAGSMAVEADTGIARLRLLDEPRTIATTATRAAARSAPAIATAAPRSGTPAVPADAVCYSFGPYDNDQAAVAAQAGLQRQALRVLAREQRTGRARGWGVSLPPLANREQADQMAQRIAAAGFSDYFVVRDGTLANSIALGRYGNEDAARRRASVLNAAGFAAQAEPIGGHVSTWLDVAVAPGFDAAAAQRRVAAPAQHALDCAGLR